MAQIKYFFSPEDLNKIEEAVKSAENEIAGEIVPVFVTESDSYPEAVLRAGLAAIIFFSVVILLIDQRMGWQQFVLLRNEWIFTGSILLGGVIGAFLSLRIPSIKRLMIGSHQTNLRVEAMAKQQFLAHELYKTQARTGILIMLSLFERQVIILGDKGINEKIQPEQWHTIVKEIISLLSKKRNTEAIILGINRCKDLLIANGFKAENENLNELPNNLRSF